MTGILFDASQQFNAQSSEMEDVLFSKIALMIIKLFSGSDN